MSLSKSLSALLASAAVLTPGLAPANERHFTQTYESATLPPGAGEIELWFSPRWGRTDSYSRLDTRAELEFGITQRLQSSIYVNFDAFAEGSPPTPGYTASLSNEWKYKLLDPVADPVGLAVYGELTLGGQEIELEAKLIVDKRIGPLLIAFNAVGEHDWELGPGSGGEREIWAEADLGAAFLLGGVGIGAEVRGESLFSSIDGYESTTFYAGPTVSYASRSWWVAASFLPQLGALKSPAFQQAYPGRLELHDHERYNARLLIGFHI